MLNISTVHTYHYEWVQDPAYSKVLQNRFSPQGVKNKQIVFSTIEGVNLIAYKTAHLNLNTVPVCIIFERTGEENFMSRSAPLCTLQFQLDF